VFKQCLVNFHIREYRDQVFCDVLLMDSCCTLLGMPWQVGRNVVHDGKKNIHLLEKGGRMKKEVIVE
jgi:hypothetical protein